MVTDRTYCTNKECLLSHKCERAFAPESEYIWYSYFQGGYNCSFFIEIKKECDHNFKWKNGVGMCTKCGEEI